MKFTQVGVQRLADGIEIALISPDGDAVTTTVCSHQAVEIGKCLVEEGHGGTFSAQDNAEVWDSIASLAVELPQSVWRDHRNKVRAALFTEQVRSAENEKTIRNLRAALIAAEPYIAAASEVAQNGCSIDRTVIRRTLEKSRSEVMGGGVSES